MKSRVHQLWDNFRSRVARDVTLTATGLYISAGLGFLTAIAAARGLGATSYGVVALVLTFSDLVLTFASVGSGAVTTRYVSAFRADGRIDQMQAISKLGYLVDLAAGVAALLIVAILVPLASQLLPELRGYGWLAVVYAASFPLASLKGTNQALLSAWMDFRRAAMLEVGERVLVLLLTVIALVSRPKLFGVVVAAGIGPAVAGALGVGLVARLLGESGGWAWVRTPLSVLGSERSASFKAYAWTYLATTFRGALTGGPVLMLGAMRGPVEAGYLKLGTTVFNVSSYLEMSLARVTYPALSARWRNGGDRSMLTALKGWTLRGGLPALAMILIMVPFVPMGVPLVFGPSYAAMGAGLQLLLVGAASGAAVFWLNNTYYVIGRVPLWAVALGLLTGASLALAALAASYAGFLGACAALSALRILFSAVMVAVLWRLVPHAPPGSGVLGALASDGQPIPDDRSQVEP